MSHQDRREQLPKGYQFGDAASSAAMQALDDSDGSVVVARTLQDGDGRVLWQKSAMTPPTPCPHRGRLRYDFTRRAYVCRCGGLIPDL